MQIICGITTIIGIGNYYKPGSQVNIGLKIRWLPQIDSMQNTLKKQPLSRDDITMNLTLSALIAKGLTDPKI